jgi:acetyl-CoA carboxylase biotin carboxyl carrier protein
MPSQAQVQVAQEAAPAARAEDASASNIVVVNSPIVGTFYRSASPDAPSYVEVGDVVKKGQVICIIEAMKLMNEIEAEVNGKIVKVLAENAQPVEYGEPLFHIEPV